MQLEDYIEKTNEAKTREELFEIYKKSLHQLGFDSVVYSHITAHHSANLKAGHALQCNFSSDWMQYYVENNYQKIDPCIEQAFRSSLPFTWEDLRAESYLSDEQLNILDEAEDARLLAGVGIPLFRSNGEIAGVGISSTENRETANKNTLSLLKCYTEQFHLIYCSMVGNPEDKIPAIPHVSQREREILKWLSCGKNASEIGTILGISHDGVKFHIKKLFSKFDANSQMLLVLKATMAGVISIDVINGTIAD